MPISCILLKKQTASENSKSAKGNNLSTLTAYFYTFGS